MSRKILLFAFTIAALVTLLSAQQTTATISGTVTDSSGALIPNIAVTATNVDTNNTRSVSTNSTGEYVIGFLPVGTYRVGVSSPGFKHYEQISAAGYYLDGGYNMSSLENGGLSAPSPDAVEEFRVTTNNYAAEFGRFQGGIVDVVMKSGTNSTHGTLFEYFRNDKLNAYG